MAVYADRESRVFTLQTKNTTYQMKADDKDVFLHTYYGEKTDNSDKSYLIRCADRGFSGNPYEVGTFDRSYSLDMLPQEYSCFGTGDYRISALRVRQPVRSGRHSSGPAGGRKPRGRASVCRLRDRKRKICDSRASGGIWSSGRSGYAGSYFER